MHQSLTPLDTPLIILQLRIYQTQMSTGKNNTKVSQKSIEVHGIWYSDKRAVWGVKLRVIYLCKNKTLFITISLP